MVGFYLITCKNEALGGAMMSIDDNCHGNQTYQVAQQAPEV
jgi:hypothetical protein